MHWHHLATDWDLIEKPSRLVEIHSIRASRSFGHMDDLTLGTIYTDSHAISPRDV